MESHHDQLSELFRLLAHPMRRSALEALGDRERSVGELAGRLGVAPSHLSQQLGILRRSALVLRRRDGSMAFYRLADPRLLDLLRLAQAVVSDDRERGAASVSDPRQG